MKNSVLTLLVATTLGVLVTGCKEEKQQRTAQSEIAQRAANSIVFSDNAEIDNIKRRIELTAQPGLIGFIILLNESGQPIMYEGVVGKVTSGGKRLTTPDRVYSNVNGQFLRPAPSDEGTWGSSNPYIFYWNTNGEYRQWSGQYLYSDKPFRLRVEPLVVTVTEKK